MAKPTQLPRWADVEAGATVEPTSALRDSGWRDRQKPAAKQLNWLIRDLGDWISWLEAGGHNEVITPYGQLQCSLGTTGAGPPDSWTYNTSSRQWADVVPFPPGMTDTLNVELRPPVGVTLRSLRAIVRPPSDYPFRFTVYEHDRIAASDTIIAGPVLTDTSNIWYDFLVSSDINHVTADGRTYYVQVDRASTTNVVTGYFDHVRLGHEVVVP